VNQIFPDDLNEDTASIKDHHHLDLHVQKTLSESKRAKAKRIGKGIWTFIETPMGAFVAIYGFLCAFWGAAIILFLVHWINAGSDYEQKLWIGGVFFEDAEK
jgi:hypothetical protein